MIYDLVVVGGGPSGSSCAEKCAEKGLDVVLLEKGGRNRYKSCGGGISIQTVELLGGIPKDVIERRGKVELRSVNSHYVNRDEKLYGGRTGYMVYRSVFDQWLRDKAEESGATVSHESEVKIIERHDDHYKAILKNGGSIKGRCIVVAVGMNASFLEKLGLEVPKALLAVQREYRLKEELVDERFGDYGVLSFNSKYSSRGYAWAFPKRSGVTVGVGDKPVFGRDLIKRLEIIVEKDPYISRKLASAEETEINGVHLSSHLVPYKVTDTTYDDGMLVIGDSAGFADPYSYEGISYGIMSGNLAAETLYYAMEKGDYSRETLSLFKDKWSAEIYEPWIKYSGKLAEMVYENKDMDYIMDKIFELANENDEVGMALSDLISGIVDSKTAYNRLMSQKIPLIKKLGITKTVSMLMRTV
ncbi:MAG: NAD(P)/FAD-dependent oxidoreductase [Candidatus Bathyarchaeia archaeon]